MDEKGKEAKKEGAHEACKLEAKGSFFLTDLIFGLNSKSNLVLLGTSPIFASYLIKAK
jgi:hypothetical protein